MAEGLMSFEMSASVIELISQATQAAYSEKTDLNIHAGWKENAWVKQQMWKQNHLWSLPSQYRY